MSIKAIYALIQEGDEKVITPSWTLIVVAIGGSAIVSIPYFFDKDVRIGRGTGTDLSHITPMR